MASLILLMDQKNEVTSAESGAAGSFDDVEGAIRDRDALDDLDKRISGFNIVGTGQYGSLSRSESLRSSSIGPSESRILIAQVEFFFLNFFFLKNNLNLILNFLFQFQRLLCIGVILNCLL